MRCTLKRAVTALEQMRPSVPLWKLTLEDYMGWVNQQREAGYSPQSLNKDLSHLRGLLEYAWRSGRSDRNVLDGFSPARFSLRVVVPKFLNLEEARRLVEACPSHTRLQRRDRLVILLLYGCGLRTSELCQLDVKDADLARQEIVIRHGKGDRARRIPVPDAVWTVLLAYLAELKGRRGALIRTEKKQTRFTSKDVCEVVRAATLAAGLAQSVTAKTLRHSFATHLMDRGVDLAVIASLMGHRSAQETGVYLHGLPGRRENAVKLLSKKPGGTKMKWDYWIKLYLADALHGPRVADFQHRRLPGHPERVSRVCALASGRGEDPSKSPPRDVLEYLDYLRRERDNGDSAINRQVTVLRNFYRAIVAMGHLEPRDNPLANFPKVRAARRKLPATLNEEEVRRV